MFNLILLVLFYDVMKQFLLMEKKISEVLTQSPEWTSQYFLHTVCKYKEDVSRHQNKSCFLYFEIYIYTFPTYKSCLLYFSDPYISPPGSSIYAAVIGIAAGVFGVAVIIIVILACLWLVKSKKRKQERFERQESIRSSIKGSTIRSRSQMSLSSSKYLYDDRSLAASQVIVTNWHQQLNLFAHLFCCFFAL